MAKKRRSKKPKSKSYQRSYAPKSRTRLLTNKWANIDLQTQQKKRRGLIHGIHETLVSRPIVQYARKAARRRNALRSPIFTAGLSLKQKI